MNDNAHDNERQKKREAYLMASRDPWLVWRLQALRAGYIPPLLPGQIPSDLARIPLGPRQDEYHIEPLLQHADKVRIRERSYIWRAFIALIVTILIFCGISFGLAITTGSKFRIGIVDRFLPHIEQNDSLHMQYRR